MRAKKAQRAEFAVLKARLGQLRSHEWIKAQMVFDQMQALVNHGRGPSNGMVCPRACKYCDRFGHSSQYCPARRRAEAAEAARVQEEGRALESMEHSPASRKRIDHGRALFDLAGVARAEGITCDYDGCGVCSACTEWHRRVQLVSQAHQ